MRRLVLAAPAGRCRARARGAVPAHPGPPGGRRQGDAERARSRPGDGAAAALARPASDPRPARRRRLVASRLRSPAASWPSSTARPTRPPTSAPPAPSGPRRPGRCRPTSAGRRSSAATIRRSGWWSATRTCSPTRRPGSPRSSTGWGCRGAPPRSPRRSSAAPSRRVADEAGDLRRTRSARPGRWRESLSEREVEIVGAIAGERLERYGYER